MSWLNFTLTNRIPRRRLTQLMGRFSQIESPLLARACIAAWKRLDRGLDLREARLSRFPSLHACFVRELKPGARPVDPDPATLVSPCDGIVVAAGPIAGRTLIQAKGRTYTLDELLLDPALAAAYEGGRYVTLRLKASMYHRFHAPHDCRVDRVDYVGGDVWNVNPPTLQRVDRVYARNERAVLRTTLAVGGHVVTLVPVAAVLVASIRLHFLDVLLHLRYRGRSPIACAASFAKGGEMGWFQHGSTIVVLAPAGFAPAPGVEDGARLRMGEPLLRLP